MIIIDLRSPKPLYEQIKDNIKQLIVTGALSEDEKLPSVRELAQTTSINPNTIQKAYKDLESDGFIYSVPGRGSFVAAPPEKKDPERIESLISSIKSEVRELSYLGMTRHEILKLIDKSIIADEEGKTHD
ncbi:MAG: GntR family transcriptional regulator [Clostridiaceae bacterium]|nr:GntR family transcriptional regulator [Clostridiaceae bacterium]